MSLLLCGGHNNYKQTILTTIAIEGETGTNWGDQKKGVLEMGDDCQFIIMAGGVGKKGECVCTKSFWGKRFM